MPPYYSSLHNLSVAIKFIGMSFICGFKLIVKKGVEERLNNLEY